jgi:hypothetical protein
MTAEAVRSQVVIRTPLLARVVLSLMLVVGVVLFGGEVVVGGVGRGDWPAAVFLTAFGALWVAGIARSARMAVLSTSDGRLVVRNQFRTHLLDRSRIEGVRRSADGFFSPTHGAFQLLLTDGSTLSLQAPMTPPFGLARRRTEAQSEMLRGWLA